MADDESADRPGRRAPPPESGDPAQAGNSADAGQQPAMPNYKGAPLDAERGPGLGCFWVQVVLLAVLVVLTPLSVVLAVEPWISAMLLILTLLLLFFVGQTAIFLLRLVAADRGARRRPRSPGARKTVGQLEEEEQAGGTADERPPEQPH